MESTNQPPTILVIDDQPPRQQATARMLTQAGYQVLAAHSGDEGIRLNQTHQPDLIVLDALAPDHAAIEVCRQIKTDGHSSSTMVLMLAATPTEPEDPAAGLAYGADGYLSHPVNQVELIAQVNSLLRLRTIDTELRARNEQLNKIISTSADGILVIDADGIVKFANHAAEKLFRREVSELTGTALGFPIITGEFVEMEIFQGEQIVTVVEMRGTPIQWEGQAAWLVNLRDVTQRTQTEAALRSSEAKFRTLYHDAPIAYLTVGADGLIHMANQRAVDLLGYTAEQLTGMPVFDLYTNTPAGKPRARIVFDQQQNAQSHRDVELQMRTADGQILWTLLTVIPVWADDGKIENRSMIIDITERKLAAHALRESEAKYRQLFASVADAVMVFDAETRRFIETNRRTLDLYGYAHEEFLQLRQSDISADPEAAEQSIQRIIAQQYGEDPLHYHRKKDGTVFPVEISGSTFTLQDRLVVMGVVRDITARVQAEEELRTLTHLLEQRVQELNCLYTIAKLVEQKGISLEELLQRTVDIIPPSWQYPNITCARIVVSNLAFESAHFQETPWCQSQDIVVQDEVVGQIAVYYLEEKPDDDEGPFLWEERHLLDAIAGQLGRIIERIQREETLQQLSRAVEQTADSVIITDRNGTIEYVNAAFEQLTGFTREEAVGHRPSILCSGQHDDQFYASLWQTILAGKAFRAEFTNRRKDGQLYYERQTITPITDAYGHITHFVSTGDDITARRKADAEIRARARHQTALSKLSQSALANVTLPLLIKNAIKILAAALDADYVDVLEFQPHQRAFAMRASTINQSFLPVLDIQAASLAHYTLRYKKVLVAETLPKESFHANLEVNQRKLVSGMCVTIASSSEHPPFGVLGVYANTPRQFTADEIYCLQVAADILAQAQQRQQIETAEYEQRIFAEALSDIAAALNSSLDLDRVLDLILTNLDKVVPHDAANIMLLESDNVAIVGETGYRNFGLNAARLKEPVPMADIPGLQCMYQQGKTQLLADKEQAAIPWINILETEGLHAYVGTPIWFDNTIIGFINLESATRGFFTAAHARRLRAFADQAAVAIKNATQYEQSRRLAMYEERQRLARELHDAVSQTLFSASIIAETLPRLWQNNPDSVRQGLHELQLLTRGALAEMRSLLIELRPSALVATEFEELIAQLIVIFKGKTQIEVAFDVEGEYMLPPKAKVAMYRIAQEALNNTTKHAHATAVAVTLRYQPERVTLLITDNGRGFNLADVSSRRMGLQIMQERAHDIGAELSIISQPKQGTQIKVVWAIREESFNV